MSFGREVAGAARFARGLRDFLATPIELEPARRELETRLLGRERAFLTIAERAIFGRSQSPYGRLMAHAGIEPGDLRGLVDEHGLEQALGRLYEAGVHVTYDEFRGRRPIRRGALEISAGPGDFDNPLLDRTWSARSSGSRSPGRRVLVDLDLLSYEAGHHGLFLDAFGVADRPYAVWLSAPPGVAGLKNVLRHAKLGRRVERWFSQHRARVRSDGAVPAAVPGALKLARALGSMLPAPEHVPLWEAREVAAWLAACKRAGRPAVIETNASSAVRICAAASIAGLDVSDSFLRVGGEPFTSAKAGVLDRAGVGAAVHYSMAEVGRVALACAAPDTLDDTHLLSDKLALLQSQPAGPLVLTTLLPFSPKLLLNVEVGDSALVRDRRCSCPLGRLGLETHLSEIRSEEKLTSEGMSFLGADLMALVEEALPERFGGVAGDFQLVETEQHGLPAVEVVVSPKIGPLDDGEVLDAVLSFLGAGDSGRRMMAERWRQANTLRVARRRPAATDTGKVLPVHVVR